MKYIQIYETARKTVRVCVWISNKQRAENQMEEVRLTNRFHANYVNIGSSGFPSLFLILCVYLNLYWKETEEKMFTFAYD